jgi:predicted acyl esterase
MTARRGALGRTRVHVVAGAALAAALMAAGCSGDEPTAGPSAPTSTTRAPRPPAELSAQTRAWWAYDRPATFEVAVAPIRVPMRDGTPLNCELSRPATGGQPAPGTFPGLVVEFTPYANLVGGMYRAEAEYFARRGYNALVCTLRGTGGSGGTWQNAMSSQDGRDAHDLVEWLATQPFADGRVGQFGESYGGQTSYGAAVERAPHLKAVVPMQPPGNLYQDVIAPGGIKATEGGSIDNWPPVGSGLSNGAIDAAAEYATNRAHPTYDDYWRERALVERVKDMAVPALTIGGWDDGYFRSGTLSLIEANPGRTWVIYGPWKHIPMVNFAGTTGANAADNLAPGVLLAWFDRWVRELPDVPVPPEPTFVSYEGPRGTGRGWLELSWTPEGTDVSTFTLGSGGSLTATDAPAGTVEVRQPAEPTTPEGSATFTTEPLDAARVLIGHARLRVRAALTAKDANFHAELIDVDPAGSETVVNDGYLKASHRKSHVTPEPVPAGTAIDYEIAIRADHHRFGPGHRVRLRISGGSSATLVPPAEPVTVTIHTGPASTLRLPAFAATS